jgi:hypothetical protein
MMIPDTGIAPVSQPAKVTSFDGVVERALAAFDQKIRLERQMQFVLVVIAWFLLLVIAWPLAVALVVLLPLLWLLSIPFRIIGVLLAAVLAFIKALLFLPARLLGHRG